MRSQIGGIKVGIRNAQDGISVVQTAEGALSETHSILQRMRDLSVQASNDGALNDDAKKNIQTEIGQLNSELSRIADTTKFNNQTLLDGNYNGTFQVGANAGQTISVNLSGKGMSANDLGVSNINVAGDASNATNAVGAAGTPGTTASKQTIGSGTDYSGAGFQGKFAALNGTVTFGAKSLDLAKVDYSGLSASATAADYKGALQSAVDAAFGSGKVTVDNAAGLTFTSATSGSQTDSAATIAANTVGFRKASGASEAIGLIDKAITKVSSTRSDLGAVQNRFDHTINNLNVAVENLSASESRIRDADMAAETLKFTRSQILSQAGTAMLAQAKSMPQGVLQLLQ
jgi:flagellin